MATIEAASGSAYQDEVELFRAVHGIPFARLKDIICTHYGPKQFDAEWRRVRDSRRGTDRDYNNNLRLYLGITNNLGRKDGAVGEIVTACKDITRMGSASKDRDETSASQESRRPQQQPQPLAEPGRDPSVLGNAAVEAAESTLELEDAEDMTTYLEAFECNTTRSCCLEIGAVGCYSDSEDDFDEVCLERDDSDEGSGRCCDSRDDRGSAPIAQVLHRVTRGDDEAVHRGILEDETVEKPKVIIDDD